jgi:hypothetical protein
MYLDRLIDMATISRPVGAAEAPTSVAKTFTHSA